MAGLVTGGADVEPSLYGRERQAECGVPDPERDDLDLAIVHEAVARKMPVLGICRGIQAINVALGGTLLQHVDHAHKGRPSEVIHEVTIAPGSLLSRVLHCERAKVNSLHHQAVENLGVGLRAAATAPDGIVEAVEHGQVPLLAVQWHPEMQADDSIARQLFAWLVNEADRFAATTAGARAD